MSGIVSEGLSKNAVRGDAYASQKNSISETTKRNGQRKDSIPGSPTESKEVTSTEKNGAKENSPDENQNVEASHQVSQMNTKTDKKHEHRKNHHHRRKSSDKDGYQSKSQGNEMEARSGKRLTISEKLISEPAKMGAPRNASVDNGKNNVGNGFVWEEIGDVFDVSNVEGGIERLFGIGEDPDDLLNPSISEVNKQFGGNESKSKEDIVFTERLPKQWIVSCGKKNKNCQEKFYVIELSPQNSVKDVRAYQPVNYNFSDINDNWRLVGSVQAYRGSTAPRLMSAAASRFTLQTVVSKYTKSRSRVSSMASLRSLQGGVASKFDQVEEPIWQRGRHFDHASDPNKKHFITIINTLNYDTKVLEATQSTILGEILNRYRNYNANIDSYRWTDIYEKRLDFELSLHDNGLVDNSYMTDEIGLDYYPVILLFFNDGFENDPPMQLDIRKAFVRDPDILCRNYQLGLLPEPRVTVTNFDESTCKSLSERALMSESQRILADMMCPDVKEVFSEEKRTSSESVGKSKPAGQNSAKNSKSSFKGRTLGSEVTDLDDEDQASSRRTLSGASHASSQVSEESGEQKLSADSSGNGDEAGEDILEKRASSIPEITEKDEDEVVMATSRKTSDTDGESQLLTSESRSGKASQSKVDQLSALQTPVEVFSRKSSFKSVANAELEDDTNNEE